MKINLRKVRVESLSILNNEKQTTQKVDISFPSKTDSISHKISSISIHCWCDILFGITTSTVLFHLQKSCVALIF